MQLAAGATAVGQPGAARLASVSRRRRGQQRRLVGPVVSRYAAGAGAVPPAAAPPPLPPAAQQQAAAQRPPVSPRRRVGVNVPPPAQMAPPGSSTLQSLKAAAGVAASGAAGSLAPAPAQQPLTVNVQQAAALTSPAEVLLSRSQVISKEVITRTSGRRLGYVQQMFVDPVSLAVVSLYLRAAANPLGAKIDQDHILLKSLRQISDVILVHNENVLLDPIADDSVGYYPLIGSTVVTQDGQELGKVRDFVFDPDTGAIGSVKYDRLGIPSIPQSLLDCYGISYSDIVAVGPTRVIVRPGTAQRAIKENDGILDSLGATAVATLANVVFGGKEGEEKRLAAAKGDGRFRSDDQYVKWYEEWGRASGAEPPGTPEYAAEQLQWKRAQGQATAASAPQPARQQAPPALPPPQTATFAQAVQAQQAASYQQAYQQQMFQPQRQAVPAGGAGGWGAPPPAQQQAAAPSPYQQAYQAPQQQQQPYQAPQQPQGYQQPPAAAAAARRPPPAQQQQYRPPPAAQQPLRPPAAAPQPQPQAAAPTAQQPPIPQNGIPIIDRTPLPPYRRRDADGNYGSPPAPAPAQQRAPVQQPAAPQRPAQPAPQRQPAPPATSASWGGSPAAQRAPQQPARMQQQAPVVVPDAVIIPGSVQPPTGGLGSAGGGAVGGPTRIADYRQL